MAKTIEPTPVLEGEAAKAFLEDMKENNVHDLKKEAHLTRCKEIFRTIKPKM